MMTKRRAFLTLLLALALTLSLAAPALAFEDSSPPMWEQWGYDSLEDFMQWNNLKTYDDYLGYIEDYVKEWEESEAQEARWQQWRTEYLAAHPEYRKNALSRQAEIYKDWGFDSADEFYEWYGFENKAEYEDWIVDYFLYDVFSAEDQARQIREEKIGLGGPAEGVGLMWQGAYVQFPDAKPEITASRTMIPIRAFMELIGAQVDYLDADKKVTLTLQNGDVLSFAVGSAEVTLTRGETVSSLQMDVAPYIKSDRTYVPVRFFSQILGYDVQWDPQYQTAIILDRAAIVAELNKNFTLINKTMAQGTVDPEKTFKTTSDLNMTLTLMDSIKGDKTAKATGRFDVLSRGYAVDGKGSIDLSSLLKTLVSDPVEYESQGLKAFEKMDYEIIGDLEKGGLYFHSQALNALTEAASPNAWFYMPYDLMDSGLMDMSPSLGDMLYTLWDGGDIHAYKDIKETAAAMAAIFGDSKFTKSGGDHLLTVTTEQMDKILFDLLGYGLYGVEELSFSLRIKSSGAYTLSFKVTTGESYAMAPKMHMSMTLSESATDASMDMELHLQNTMKLKMNVTANTRASSETLRTAPPAGAEIVDFYESMDMGVYAPLLTALQAAALIRAD